MAEEKDNLHDEVITVKHKTEEEGDRSPLPDYEKLPATVKYIRSKQTKKVCLTCSSLVIVFSE